MIIATPADKLQKTSIEDFLYFDRLFATLSPTNNNFINGLVVLTPDIDQELPLPVYLRSEMAEYLRTISKKSLQWNTAVVIPDFVQKQLLHSERLYPDIPSHLHKHIRPKDENDVAGSRVDAAEGRIGILETEKLLLLEMLLGERRWDLENIELVLRDHKVFCLKFGGEVDQKHKYMIVKFDSPSAIDREYENYGAIHSLFEKVYGTITVPNRQTWIAKTYMLEAPAGQSNDLFKVIPSTVETVGEVQDWKGQTLKDKWSEVIGDGIIHKIIDNVFDTLELLYQAGYQEQEIQPNPRLRSINEIYRDFYRSHIMPVDCVVKCKLDDIKTKPDLSGRGVAEGFLCPPRSGEPLTGQDYKIREIKLRESSVNKAGPPDLSLLVANQQQMLIELKLGSLGGFYRRRQLYSAKIEEGAWLDFKGMVESNFDETLRESVLGLQLHCKEFGTERVIIEAFENEDLDARHVKFIDDNVYVNPLYIYNQIYGNSEIPEVSLQINSLSTWIHGDLNVGNIITTPSGDVRIIDFARLVKNGPLEFDFAELEIDIRIRNLVEECRKMRDPESNDGETESLKTIVKNIFMFEENLLEVFAGREEEYLVGGITERFKPSFLAIAKIRKKLMEMYGKLAPKSLSSADVLASYMTAIYFESLAALSFGSEPLAKTWALISATVACKKLFHSREISAEAMI